MGAQLLRGEASHPGTFVARSSVLQSMDELDLASFLRLGYALSTHRSCNFLKLHGILSNPVRSPNPMAWPKFVKTFKRNYVDVHHRPDAETVMAQLAHWFEDYNEHHPHERPKMKSPSQFIRSQLVIAPCPV